MIRIEVKHDTLDKDWKRLSVGFHDECPIQTMKFDATLYVLDYARNHQMNPHQLSYRLVDRHGTIIHVHESNAIVNRPKK